MNILGVFDTYANYFKRSFVDGRPTLTLGVRLGDPLNEDFLADLANADEPTRAIVETRIVRNTGGYINANISTNANVRHVIDWLHNAEQEEVDDLFENGSATRDVWEDIVENKFNKDNYSIEITVDMKDGGKVEEFHCADIDAMAEYDQERYCEFLHEQNIKNGTHAKELEHMKTLLEADTADNSNFADFINGGQY